MAKESQMLYTEDGLNKLKAELDDLKNVQRPRNLEAIAVARSFGDLSENAEYDEARNEQAKVEARIKELEELILGAVIVDESKIDTSIINMGSIVKVYDKEFDETVEYSIVGSNEADPFQNRVSDMSPIGRALIGKRAGDEVTVEAPNGNIVLQIIEVTR